MDKELFDRLSFAVKHRYDRDKENKDLIDKLRSVARYEKKREYNEINVGEIIEQAATAINVLLLENQAFSTAASDFSTRAEAAVAESRRWVQVCEAQNKQIDRLQTQVENTAKELEALKKDYREFRIDAWNTMYDMLGAGGYVDRDIKGFFDRWRKR